MSREQYVRLHWTRGAATRLQGIARNKGEFPQKIAKSDKSRVGTA
jgi:hypothetical protein